MKVQGWIFLFCLLSAALFAVACAPVTPPAASAPAAEAAPSLPAAAAVAASTPLTIVVNALPVSLDPYAENDAAANYLLKLLYDAPWVIDKQGAILAGLAQTVTIAPDSAVYTLTLRSGVTFHDGSPLDAQSVVAAWERGVRLGQEQWLAATMVTAVDPATVRVEVASGSDRFLDLVAPAWAILKEVPGADGQPSLVGTGPFQAGAHSATTFVLQPNPSYWGGFDPAAGAIVLQPIADLKEGLQAVLSGRAGLAFGYSEQQLADLPQEGAINIFQPSAIIGLDVTVAAPMPTVPVTSLVEALQNGIDPETWSIDDGLITSDLSATWNPRYYIEDLAGGVMVDPGFYVLATALAKLDRLGITQGAEIELGCSWGDVDAPTICSQAEHSLIDLGLQPKVVASFDPAETFATEMLLRTPLLVKGSLRAVANFDAIDSLFLQAVAQGLAQDFCPECAGGDNPTPLPVPIPPIGPLPIPIPNGPEISQPQSMTIVRLQP